MNWLVVGVLFFMNIALHGDENVVKVIELHNRTNKELKAKKIDLNRVEGGRSGCLLGFLNPGFGICTPIEYGYERRMAFEANFCLKEASSIL